VYLIELYRARFFYNALEFFDLFSPIIHPPAKDDFQPDSAMILFPKLNEPGMIPSMLKSVWPVHVFKKGWSDCIKEGRTTSASEDSFLPHLTRRESYSFTTAHGVEVISFIL